MSGGNRRAGTISAACSGATPLGSTRLLEQAFRRCPRRGCRGTTTATLRREAPGIAVALHRFFVALLLATSLIKSAAAVPSLALPPRSPEAFTGSQLVTNATLLSSDLLTREKFIKIQTLRGNVPDFLRQLWPVNLTNISASRTNVATIYVTPNYLALGHDDDYLLIPMTPATAQRIADAAGCLLPTRKMVNAIYAAAEIKLPPQPLRPDATMTTVPVFWQHNEIVRTQLMTRAKSASTLIAGHKKDVVITPKLIDAPNRVAIYGWHRTNGVAIQPLYLGHNAAWVDYSHGLRLVSQAALFNGQPTNISALLSDSNLCSLFSDEGLITNPRYATNFRLSVATERSATGPRSQRATSEQGVESDSRASDQRSAADGDRPRSANQRWPQGFNASKHFDELTRELNLPNGVRVIINTPPARSFATNKNVLLIYYALPNGNTIEQTVGRQPQDTVSRNYNIQHIGAQTRFLRAVLTNQTVVITYLENSLLNWPAWRRAHGNDYIPALFDAVRNIFADYREEIVLTGHSGGGSLTFGYLNAIAAIPADIKRIAFLDSNYAYETTNHFGKLTQWLNASKENRLVVLAYHDSIALLDGKTFVSERGGTWGRSQAMLADLRREFSFHSRTNNTGLQGHVAADGRIQFLLQENPERKILHSVQVDRNGFIHALLIGTPGENSGYEYFGARAYSEWIQD